ncbi:MAG: lytic transglycosylase domain-containing protein [Gammaproteobacteria bacterium]|nr:lytic transglycosylase domain-containing protein [Gammaproteobacteria bacterium]
MKYLNVTALFIIFSLANTPAIADSQYQRQAPTPELRALLKAAIHDASSFEDRFEAEVWLMDMSMRMSRYLKDTQERLTILHTTHHEAKRVKLSPELVLAVMDVESRFNRYAISSVGAQGLMQVMPFWRKELNEPQANLFNIKTNLRMGTTILRYYYDMEKGDLRKALARYNGSVGKRKYPDKVFTALSERWFVK